MKYQTKAQMMWNVSKEQEEEFRRRFIFDGSVESLSDFDELIKLIRGAEYRRGKEDGKKEAGE